MCLICNILRVLIPHWAWVPIQPAYAEPFAHMVGVLRPIPARMAGLSRLASDDSRRNHVSASTALTDSTARTPLSNLEDSLKNPRAAAPGQTLRASPDNRCIFPRRKRPKYWNNSNIGHGATDQGGMCDLKLSAPPSDKQLPPEPMEKTMISALPSQMRTHAGPVRFCGPARVMG